MTHEEPGQNQTTREERFKKFVADLDAREKAAVSEHRETTGEKQGAAESGDTKKISESEAEMYVRLQADGWTFERKITGILSAGPGSENYTIEYPTEPVIKARGKLERLRADRGSNMFIFTRSLEKNELSQENNSERKRLNELVQGGYYIARALTEPVKNYTREPGTEAVSVDGVLYVLKKRPFGKSGK